MFVIYVLCCFGLYSFVCDKMWKVGFFVDIFDFEMTVKELFWV